MRIMLAAFFCLPSWLLFAQSVSGTVTDAETGLPIAGAVIYLPDLKKGAVADEAGKFVIEQLPSGKFLIEVRSLGYAPAVQVVTVRDIAITVNIVLSNAITELNEIVISGVSHSTELKRNPVSISTMNADALSHARGSNIIERISQKPGVSQITTGTAISKPLIRGLGYNRVIVLYDGVRQEGQQWGDEHGVEIDEFSVDRVEIIKGAGSIMYGSDGIGGVINLLPANPVHDGVISGEFQTRYHTNNGLFAGSLMNAGNLGGVYWNGRASIKEARPYQNRLDGRVVNSGFKEHNLNLTAGLNKAWGYTQFSAAAFQQTVGLVTGDRDALGNFLLEKNINGQAEMQPASDDELEAYSIFIPRQSIRHRRVSNTTNLFFGDARVQVNAGYQQNRRKEFGDVVMPAQPELSFDLGTVNYTAIVYLPELKGWNFSAGTSGMYQQNENAGGSFIIPWYRLSDAGFVAHVKKSGDDFSFAGGIRFDRRNLRIDALRLDESGVPTHEESGVEKFRGGELSFSNISATAGLTYQFSAIASLKLNASRGFRAPNISELASNGKHEGSLRYEYGNHSLKAETSFQTDASFLLNSDHVSADISIFQNSIDHYIFLSKLLAQDGTDSIADPSDPVPAYAYVQGRARLQGGEISVDLHPHPLDWLHVENSISFVYGENRSATNDASRYLPFIPPPRIQSEIRANTRKWKNLTNCFIKIQCVRYAAQRRVLLENNTETPTPAYMLWNAGIGFEFNDKKGALIFTLEAMMTNLADKGYQDHLSRLKYAAVNPATGRIGVFNMGRDVSIQLTAPISFRKAK